MLSLSETAIADDAFAALARTRLSRHLQQLNLSHTLITDAGATHLTSTFGYPYFERWQSIFLLTLPLARGGPQTQTLRSCGRSCWMARW